MKDDPDFMTRINHELAARKAAPGATSAGGGRSSSSPDMEKTL